ncbi:MAG: hypothetical protein HFI09_04650 [Bacilli bacterium]|nr:hypothetical protein [Bacilli bacterium]
MFQYIDVIKLQTEEVILQMDGFQLRLLGTDFRVKKLESREILICGNLERLERII